LAAVTVLAQDPGAPRFRSGVDLVALDVYVADREGHAVPALRASDFLVLDDRVPQPLTFFSADGGLPLTAVVLIDRSSSMHGPKLERAKAAAIAFLQQLGPEDTAEVLAFNQRAERVVPLGLSAAAAVPLVGTIGADGQTALFEAILVAMRELQAARQPGLRREALIVLSDGEDTMSRVSFEDLLEDVQRTGVLVYGISLRSDERDKALPPLREFAQLARDSGGRAIAVRDPTTLDAVYADIGAELRHMYRLAYVPAAPGDGRWHPVSVRILDQDARVRTRRGYYAPKSIFRAGGHL
jgi:VWFA-related protein